MKPTPEQITAMTARGWTYDRDAFVCGGGKAIHAFDAVELPVVYGRIEWRTGWVASYGTSGNGHSTFVPHPTPEDAAREAEKWFRHVVRGLPGLGGDK